MKFKPKIDKFTLTLIKENIIFFIFFFIFFAILVVFVPREIGGYQELKLKKSQVETEILNLEKKDAIINTFNEKEMNDLIAVLNMVLPSKEDYFSMFQTLDNISSQTGFRIIGYAVDPSQELIGKIGISVGASGDADSFVKFLETYQYKGGRLITMDSIQFIPSTSQSSVSLNFYSNDVQVAESDTIPKLDTENIRLIKKIAQELKNSNVTSEVTIEDGSYTPKLNPFEL